jgi:hypothetical protein
MHTKCVSGSPGNVSAVSELRNRLLISSGLGCRRDIFYWHPHGHTGGHYPRFVYGIEVGCYCADYLCLASESPQTFHQALLLIASLALVAPKSVLHNIMPVFTFMGSNVFHRDDNYSFRVVQKVGVPWIARACILTSS